MCTTSIPSPEDPSDGPSPVVEKNAVPPRSLSIPALLTEALVAAARRRRHSSSPSRAAASTARTTTGTTTATTGKLLPLVLAGAGAGAGAGTAATGKEVSPRL